MADFILFISDGRDNRGKSERIEAAAANAASKGITVVAVGIGEHVNKNDLQMVTGDAARVFILDDDIEKLISSICESFQGDGPRHYWSKLRSRIAFLEERMQFFKSAF